MKRVSKTTLLKKGEITYQPIEIGGVIYWHSCEQSLLSYNYFPFNGTIGFLKSSDRFKEVAYEIVAQSEEKLEGVPVIAFDFEQFTFDWAMREYERKTGNAPNLSTDTQLLAVSCLQEGYKGNKNCYSGNDIKKALKLSRLRGEVSYSKKEIFEIVSEISILKVNEKFQIIDYD